MASFNFDENNKIATRESFGKALVELADDKVVVLDADLDTSTKTEYFKEKYPNRFIENGIAEADMIGTAAGLATCGKIPFAATFAAFATGRVYDQIRCSVAYPKLNVKICGTHSGVTVGEDGATHQMLEDIALMRVLPNMVVVSPSDDTETRALVKEIAKYDGPVYLRLSRLKTPTIYKKDELDDKCEEGNDSIENVDKNILQSSRDCNDHIEFKIGKGIQIGNGTDATIFATGDVVAEALKAKEKLKEEGIDIRVIDMHTIKPIDKELILKSAKETKLLFTLEDHNIIGGLGSAVCEVLCDNFPKQVFRIGINDSFGRSGIPGDLMKYFGIDAESIEETIKKAEI